MNNNIYRHDGGAPSASNLAFRIRIARFDSAGEKQSAKAYFPCRLAWLAHRLGVLSTTTFRGRPSGSGSAFFGRYGTGTAFPPILGNGCSDLLALNGPRSGEGP